MSSSFTKLASSITDSTIWLAPDSTRIVWICLLAMADQWGRVMAAVPGLAHRARVGEEETRKALASFLAPDIDSRTRAFEGRRIEEIDGGWRLLNHAKYRDLRAADDRREQNRLSQARARAKKKSAQTVSTRQPKSAESAQAEADDKKEIPVSLRKPRQPAAGKSPEGRFPEFWAAWPATDRRTDRKKCLAKWRGAHFDDQADEILEHVAAMKQTRKWAEGYEPAPLRYLNGEQWLDGNVVVQAQDRFAGAM